MARHKRANTTRYGGLGWRPSLPDHRDLKFRPLISPQDVPAETDLRGQMPPIYDQGQLGCHDEATQVLTESGWQDWPSYDGISRLGTVNPANHALEFQQPVDLQAYRYNGPLSCVDRRGLNFAVTPNHRMYVRRWNEARRLLDSDYSFREAATIGWYSGLLHAPSGWVGIYLSSVRIGCREYSGDDFLALLALVISDGWVGGTASNWNTVSFCCFRDNRLPMVRELAGRLGLSELPSRPGVWKWSDGELAEWLRQNAFVRSPYRSPNKRIPEIVRQCAPAQIERFLRFYGDQSGNGVFFYSASRQIIDDLQELILRLGRRSSISERDPRSTTMRDGRRIEAENCIADLTLVVRASDRLSIGRKRDVTDEPYSGYVFCATVPNGLLVTRRSGQVLVSGNSCTANAAAGLVQYDRVRQGFTDFTPSRLFIYWWEREIEGTVDSDAGAEIRDAVKVLNVYGAPPETDYPYVIDTFTQPPTAQANDDAKAHVLSVYASVAQDEYDIMAALAQGNPVITGISVYESFESETVAQTGVVPMPGPSEGLLGGHAVLVVGYRRNVTWMMRNSWGPGWGMQGYFTVPWEYLLSPGLSEDMFTGTVESG